LPVPFVAPPFLAFSSRILSFMSSCRSPVNHKLYNQDFS
jgi:hypothetical protein